MHSNATYKQLNNYINYSILLIYEIKLFYFECILIYII